MKGAGFIWRPSTATRGWRTPFSRLAPTQVSLFLVICLTLVPLYCSLVPFKPSIYCLYVAFTRMISWCMYVHLLTHSTATRGWRTRFSLLALTQVHLLKPARGPQRASQPVVHESGSQPVSRCVALEETTMQCDEHAGVGCRVTRFSRLALTQVLNPAPCGEPSLSLAELGPGVQGAGT